MCFASWKEIHINWFQFNLNRNKGLQRIDLTLFVYRIKSRLHEPLHERFHEGVLHQNQEWVSYQPLELRAATTAPSVLSMVRFQRCTSSSREDLLNKGSGTYHTTKHISPFRFFLSCFLSLSLSLCTPEWITWFPWRYMGVYVFMYKFLTFKDQAYSYDKILMQENWLGQVTEMQSQSQKIKGFWKSLWSPNLEHYIFMWATWVWWSYYLQPFEGNEL